MKLLVAVLLLAIPAFGQLLQPSSSQQAVSVLTPGKGLELASGTTINPTHRMHDVTGVTTVQTITAPAGLAAGDMLILVPKGIFAIGTSGNVIIGVTAVVNKALILVWDGTAWIPGYLL